MSCWSDGNLEVWWSCTVLAKQWLSLLKVSILFIQLELGKEVHRYMANIISTYITPTVAQLKPSHLFCQVYKYCLETKMSTVIIRFWLTCVLLCYTECFKRMFVMNHIPTGPAKRSGSARLSHEVVDV